MKDNENFTKKDAVKALIFSVALSFTSFVLAEVSQYFWNFYVPKWDINVFEWFVIYFFLLFLAISAYYEARS